jgi:hypothetical protein
VQGGCILAEQPQLSQVGYCNCLAIALQQLLLLLLLLVLPSAPRSLQLRCTVAGKPPDGLML